MPRSFGATVGQPDVVRRSLFILASLSALLCVAVGVLWWRSHQTHYMAMWTSPTTAWQVSSMRGKVWVFTHPDKPAPTPTVPTLDWHDAVRHGALETLHFDQYALGADDKERQVAADELESCGRAARNAAGFYRQVKSGIDAGNVKWKSILSWVRREYLTTMADEQRAWAHLQAAEAQLQGGDRLGFRWFQRFAPCSRFVAVPYWSLSVLTAVLPAMSLLFWHRSRRRKRAGHCPTCGYDLRAIRTAAPSVERRATSSMGRDIRVECTTASASRPAMRRRPA